jgi:hypothetical protein
VATIWQGFGVSRQSAQKLAANPKICGKYATGNVPHRETAV